MDNIYLKMEKEEIFAFLGPNGAGKSTTIKMLKTLLKPTAFEIILGKVLGRATVAIIQRIIVFTVTLIDGFGSANIAAPPRFLVSVFSRYYFLGIEGRQFPQDLTVCRVPPDF